MLDGTRIKNHDVQRSYDILSTVIEALPPVFLKTTADSKYCHIIVRKHGC